MNYKIFILKQKLLEVITKSSLPVFVIELLLKDILNEINEILIEQIQLESKNNKEDTSIQEFQIQVNNGENKTINFEERNNDE